MKVLLISPPVTFHRLDQSLPIKSNLLGLTYVAAALLQDNHEVKILDCFVTSSDCYQVNEDLTRYSLDDDEILAEISSFKPDVVGITSMFTSNCQDPHDVAAIVKRHDQAILVVLGGSHATLLPEIVMKDNNIDLVVLGEGELTIREVLNRHEKGAGFRGVAGTVHRENGKIITEQPRVPVKDLDDIPFPAKELIEKDRMILADELKHNPFIMRKPVGHMQTSRGCPNNCYFCSFIGVFGRKWRARSAKNVVDEMEILNRQFGYREIHFVDDNSTVLKRRIHDICDEIISRGLDVRIATPAGIAIQTLDVELLKKMKKAGFYRLCFGIETGDPESVKQIGKKVDLDKARYIIRESNRLGFWTAATFIFGHPHEKMKEIRATINFAKSSHIDFPAFVILVPQIGTRAYDILKQHGTVDYDSSCCIPHSGEWHKVSAAYYIGGSNKHFTNEELQRIKAKAYREFFIHKIFSIRTYINLVRKIRSLEDVSYVFRLMTVPLKMMLSTLRGKKTHYIPKRKPLT